MLGESSRPLFSLSLSLSTRARTHVRSLSRTFHTHTNALDRCVGMGEAGGGKARGGIYDDVERTFAADAPTGALRRPAAKVF